MHDSCNILSWLCVHDRTHVLCCLQDGIELSSAEVGAANMPHPVKDAGTKGKAKQVLQRQTTDEFMAQDNALDIADLQLQDKSQPQSLEERRKQFQGQGWSDVALQDK